MYVYTNIKNAITAPTNINIPYDAALFFIEYLQNSEATNPANGTMAKYKNIVAAPYVTPAKIDINK